MLVKVTRIRYIQKEHIYSLYLQSFWYESIHNLTLRIMPIEVLKHELNKEYINMRLFKDYETCVSQSNKTSSFSFTTTRV